MKSFYLYLFLLIFILSSCGTITLQKIENQEKITGQTFYEAIMDKSLSEREAMALRLLLAGNFPPFMRQMTPVRISIPDPPSGKMLRAIFYVTPDYVSVGTRDDWARIPLNPGIAQILADSLACFLPTPKMVDAIWNQAAVQLDPVPMYAYRDSAVTFWQHHLIIEGQRKGRKGLIAGIKKDIVLSDRVAQDPRPNRVAIYGWHRKNGEAIQPLYSGHVRHYVDYSHGVRLIWRNIRVFLPERRRWVWMDYTQVLSDTRLRGLLCDEPDCSFLRYLPDDL